MSRHITIIGAGLVGLATAFELTELDPECSVSILDPAPLSGASHHAAGMLAPAAEMQYQQDELLPLMRQSALWYPSLVRRVALAAHSDPDDPHVTGFRRDGTYVVAADSADRVHLAETRDFQESFGMKATQVTVRQLRQAEPSLSPNLSGAVHIPGDHQIDPRVFGELIIGALKNRGVKIIKRFATLVDVNSRDNLDGTSTNINDANNSADVTIVANGLGASEFFPYLQLRPVWGDVLRLRVPAELDPLVTSVIRGFVRDRPVYVVPRIDGGLVLGATSREDGRGRPLVGGALDLMRDADTICPGIRECTIDEITAGARPGTPDDLPYIGIDDGTGAVVSTGYFRHGILLTALGARVGAALATAGREATADESGSADAQTCATDSDSLADEHGSLEKRLVKGNELLARADDDDAPELTLDDILASTDIHRDV
ncbi:glycine oxidase ThiO [Corynebacterium kroppenstedtii]|uniref:glycine oxidase ThiO n=1 Tax=Corynebacterium pseudokroppenstedtii TaxID=2804917 RepID=UPI001951F7EA|nr:glycine oxidase ThiO [Corynebacterium pseudokroppenstedtii]MDK7146962.1 glycine oxidase ThiO [Corynebacterium pseudokroppenstedtii]MDU6479974.1 glycine oxidase ThiO [Corynebacterium kroppenstedtii]QRP14067.1 glycine oxidase ThiO [Corynebacterium kroppenstedtii]